MENLSLTMRRCVIDLEGNFIKVIKGGIMENLSLTMRRCVIFITLVCVFPFVGIAFGANFPLEVISPRNSMNSNNRVLWAYPAIEYNIRVSAIGGNYPYSFELILSPSGMSINRSNGIISWSNPAIQGSPHQVIVKVTDTKGTSETVSWYVTVDPSKFIFVDSNTEISGNGTPSNPFKDISDWWGAEASDTYAGYFIYFRAGTYHMPDVSNMQGPDEYSWVWNLRLFNHRKPVVWLGYPGETAIIDMSMPNSNYGRLYLNGVHNAYFDNICFKGMQHYAIQFKGGFDHNVFRRLLFDRLKVSESPGANNESFIRVMAEGTSEYGGDYHIIQDCIMQHIEYGCAIKLYHTNKFLIEDNIIDDVDGAETIAIKSGNVRTTVRGNALTKINHEGIGGGWNTAHSNSNPSRFRTADLEICYNFVSGYTGFHGIIANRHANSDAAYIYRNTIVGEVLMMNFDSDGEEGKAYVYGNVIINNVEGLNGDHISYETNEYYEGGPNNYSRVIVTNDLVGTQSDNIIDQNGKLVGIYRTQYLGARGWEISSGSEIPQPPFNLRIIQ